MSSPEKPKAPEFQLPEWAKGLPEETINLIRQGIGQQATTPPEYDIASQSLQSLLGYNPTPQIVGIPEDYATARQGFTDLAGYQPDQFALPMDEIQQALAAQQAIQLEQYQKQIRPMLAQQGQLDSSYYTNLLGDYMKNQQAQTYGTTADLLTQQAQQNAQIQQWLPQFQSGVYGSLANLGTQQSGIDQYNAAIQNQFAQFTPQLQSQVAGQLAGIGGQRTALDQFNLQLPYQTYIPAMQNQYGQGLQQGNAMTNQANLGYQADMQQYQQQQQQMQGLINSGTSLALGAATGGLSGLAGLYGQNSSGQDIGFGGGALMGLQGITPQSYGLSQNLGGLGSLFGGAGATQQQQTPSSSTGNVRYNPNRLSYF